MYLYEIKENCVVFKLFSNFELGCKMKHKSTLYLKELLMVQDTPTFVVLYCVYLHLHYICHMRIVVRVASVPAVTDKVCFIYSLNFNFFNFFFTFTLSTESFLNKYLKTRYPHSTFTPYQFCTLENCLLVLQLYILVLLSLLSYSDISNLCLE